VGTVSTLGPPLPTCAVHKVVSLYEGLASQEAFSRSTFFHPARERSNLPFLGCEGPLLMLWTAPPPARECHRCGVLLGHPMIRRSQGMQTTTTVGLDITCVLFDHLIGAAKRRQWPVRPSALDALRTFRLGGVTPRRPTTSSWAEGQQDRWCERLRLALTLSDTALPCRSRAWSSS